MRAYKKGTTSSGLSFSCLRRRGDKEGEGEEGREREKGGRKSGEGKGGEATIWNPTRWVRKISLVGVIIKKYVSLRSEPHRLVSFLSPFLPTSQPALSLSPPLPSSLLSRETDASTFALYCRRHTMCFNREIVLTKEILNRCEVYYIYLGRIRRKSEQ